MRKLPQKYPGVLDIETEELWVVSDIHGMGEVFFPLLEQWQTARSHGQNIHLVFLGDVVHRYDAGEDASLAILRALRSLQDAPVTCLLGNHELMHLYHLPVQRAGVDYVQPLEKEMGTERAELMRFVGSWPVAVRWHNVLLHHVGASVRILRTDAIPSWPFFAHWDHAKLLQRVAAHAGLDAQVDVWNGFDARLGEALLETRTGRFIWDSYFLKNEMHADNYEELAREMLDVFSFQHVPLEYMVTGHIPAREGHKVLGRQMRLCSAWGADESSRRVLALKSRPFSMDDLEKSLKPPGTVR